MGVLECRPSLEQPDEAASHTGISDLPDAALEAIFGCCCSTTKNLQAVRLVCSHWHNVLTQSTVPFPRLTLTAPLLEGWMQQHAKHMVQLTLKSADNLGCLQGLHSMQALGLEDCRRLSDLSPVTQLTKLHMLLLRNMRLLSDLQPVAKLPQLHTLVMDRCSARDLTPLSAMQQLASLHLSLDCWAVVGVTFPSQLPSLKQLRVMAPLQDLSPLSAYTTLTSLELFAVSVHDLAPLSHLKALLELDLHHLHEEQGTHDMSALSCLVNLASLGLQGSDPDVVEHSPWRSLAPTLTRLDLHGSCVSDLRPLQSLTALRSLSLSQARELRDIAALSSLTCLQELVLTGSKGVRDLRPILHLTALTRGGLLKKP